MNLAGIVKAGKGRAGHWRVTPAEFEPGSGQANERALWHYDTVMLAWAPDEENRILYLSTGHGSVSDQQGVNTALKILGGYKRSGPAFRFVRAGGAHYEILDASYTLAPASAGSGWLSVGIG